MAEDPAARRRDPWTAYHFSQSNPEGAGQGDVGALLRRVADPIDALGQVDVQDLVLHTDITADGDWHSITVYYQHAGDDRDTEPTN
ncbi:hypothetical protein I6A60_40205 [Frankia sp. AgB1.9]|uniref:hypothetical protein n=1 Tax=unclassified Frankia TaxID=2632575 RepID=UPI001933D7E6|nr:MULTISPECIES: hypothetical protein [unclassified Frankia]MBL7490417.1 hypothetical protein [Frankia sp. AgW1.1]MBL7554008.1 hypothetical protein [Frankia sp. AgB1.9]MBL7624636.1 hypothetical protein [Frankia sp. AgB1.8]